MKTWDTGLLGRKTAAAWKVGASRNLPLATGSLLDESWDGPAAEASIWAHCGFDGDSPDTGFARKAFLAYDSADLKKKGSYKLPFAKVVDGRLTAMPAGIRASASRLPQADIPDDCANKARAVLDAYEEKMKDKGATPTVRNKAITAATAPKIKGLYDVAYLAQFLINLGYLHSDSVREREFEGDDSTLPEMLASALKLLADAFLAMSKEEVGELLAGHGVEIEDDDYVTAAASVQAKRFRSAFVKAGRVLSEENLEHVKGIIECFGKAMDCRTKALDSHGTTHDSLADLAAHIETGAEHAKCLMKAGKKPKPKPDQGDGSGAGDGGANDDDYEDPTADDEDDVELAAAAERRKRALDLVALGGAA